MPGLIALVKSGVGLRLADSKRLTAEKLAQAIHTTVTDFALRIRAADLGAKSAQKTAWPPRWR